MTTSLDSWPEALTKSVVGQISRYRKERGLSYQQLADRCTALGYPTIRTTLANLEAHKRKSLTLHELIILAAALEVPPVQLMFPGIPDGEIQILPNKTQNAWDALKWFTGETLEPSWQHSNSDDPNYYLALLRWREQIPAKLKKFEESLEQERSKEAEAQRAYAETKSSVYADPTRRTPSEELKLGLAEDDLNHATRMVEIVSDGIRTWQGYYRDSLEALREAGFTVNELKVDTDEGES